VSKASHRREYPVRRPKEQNRDLLKLLLDQERRRKAKEEKELRIRISKVIPSSDTVSSPSNSMDGM
jgi:hypothetical protein